MYIYIMRKFTDVGVFKRFIMPIFAIIGSLFFTLCGTGLFTLITTGDATGVINFLYFIVLFAIFVGPSIFFYRKDAEPTATTSTENVAE